MAQPSTSLPPIESQVPKQRIKKKKPVATNPDDPSTDRPKRRKKKPQSTNNALSGAPDITEGLEDDIRDRGDETVEEGNLRPEKAVLNTNTNIFFVEQGNKFKQMTAAQIMARHKQQHVIEEEPQTDFSGALEFGLISQNALHIISTFCHGILSGLAVCEAAGRYFLRSIITTRAFLQLMGMSSQILTAVFYALSAICLLSALDRYDIAKPSKKILAQPGIIFVFLAYGVAVLTSVLMYPVDLIFVLHVGNLTHFNDEYGEATLGQMNGYCIARAVSVLLAWAVISFRPNTNKLSANIKDLRIMKPLENMA